MTRSFTSFRVASIWLIQKVYEAEGREILDGVERGIGDVVDLAQGLQVLGQLRDDRQQGLLARLVSGEGQQEERDATLTGRRHLEDELPEIPLAVLGVVVGDGQVTGVEVGILLAADDERGGH